MFKNKKTAILLLQNTPILLMVAVFGVFGLLTNRFFQLQNIVGIFTDASYIGILAVGMTFVLLTAGIDLSVGANMYLSSVVAGLLVQNYQIPVWLALVAALAIGFAFGALNAFFIIRLRILPLIVTIATMIAGRGLTLLLSKSQAVPLPDSILAIGYERVLGVPIPLVIFAVIVMAAWILLKMTPLGRQIYALGNDPEAAKKAGINTKRILMTVYIISGVLAAIGGIISVAQCGIVNAGFGDGDEFDAIAAAVLGGASLFGGIGSVFPGTVIGAVLVQTIQAGMVFLQVDLYIQPLVTAGIILLAVFLDSLRKRYLEKLGRRFIYTIKTEDRQTKHAG